MNTLSCMIVTDAVPVELTNAGVKINDSRGNYRWFMVNIGETSREAVQAAATSWTHSQPVVSVAWIDSDGVESSGSIAMNIPQLLSLMV